MVSWYETAKSRRQSFVPLFYNSQKALRFLCNKSLIRAINNLMKPSLASELECIRDQ